MSKNNTDDDRDIDNNAEEEEETETEDEDEESDDSDDSDNGNDSEDEDSEGSEDEDEESDDSEDDADSDEDEDADEGEKVTISKKELDALRLRAGQKSAKDRIYAKKGKGDKAPAESGTSEATLARLEARGILDPEDQKVVLDVMKRGGLSMHQAVADDYVKSRLESNKRKRGLGKALVTKKGTGSQGSSTPKDVGYYIKKGIAPDPKKQPKLFAKYQDELAKAAERRS